MGACASVPKGMRDESSSAPPPPEPSKDESVQAEEVIIKPQNDQNDANGVDESKKQSLGSLLDQPEEEAEKPQVEVPAEPKKEEAEAEPKKEEPKAEAKEEAKKEEPKN